MDILPIRSDMRETNELLTRIAVALERIAGPPVEPHEIKRNSKVIRYGQETDQWNKEQIKEMVASEGLSPEESAELLAQVLGQYGEAIGSLTDEDEIPAYAEFHR